MAWCEWPHIASLNHNDLSHWGLVRHICICKLAIIGSDNGLSIYRRQAITGTNAEVLAIRLWVIPFSEISSQICIFSFEKIYLKMSSGKWWPLCLGLNVLTVYPKKYAHGFCFAVLCCGYTLTDFPISIRLTSLALWQSNDCPSASKATLMNMDEYFMWIHYERLYNHNKTKHNKTVCIFLGIYCKCSTNTLILFLTSQGHRQQQYWQCAVQIYKDRLIYVWRFPC